MNKKSILNLLTLSNVDVLTSEQANQIVGGKKGNKVKMPKMKSMKKMKRKSHSTCKSSSSSSQCVIVPVPIIP